jgi:hypothetical protein
MSEKQNARILRQLDEIAELRRSGDESDAESARLLSHARKVKGDRDVHSVYEVLDLIPRLRAEIAELRKHAEEAISFVREIAEIYSCAFPPDDGSDECGNEDDCQHCGAVAIVARYDAAMKDAPK